MNSSDRHSVSFVSFCTSNCITPIRPRSPPLSCFNPHRDPTLHAHRSAHSLASPALARALTLSTGARRISPLQNTFHRARPTRRRPQRPMRHPIAPRERPHLSRRLALLEGAENRRIVLSGGCRFDGHAGGDGGGVAGAGGGAAGQERLSLESATLEVSGLRPHGGNTALLGVSELLFLLRLAVRFDCILRVAGCDYDNGVFAIRSNRLRARERDS